MVVFLTTNPSHTEFFMKNFAIAALLALSLTACATGKDAYYYCVDDASGKQICTEKKGNHVCDKSKKDCCKKGKKKSK